MYINIGTPTPGLPIGEVIGGIAAIVILTVIIIIIFIWWRNKHKQKDSNGKDYKTQFVSI